MKRRNSFSSFYAAITNLDLLVVLKDGVFNEKKRDNRVKTQKTVSSPRPLSQLNHIVYVRIRHDFYLHYLPIYLRKYMYV